MRKKIIELWNKYLQNYLKHYSLLEINKVDGLPYLRDKLFISILLLTLPIGFLAYVPSIIVSISTDELIISIFDTIAIIVILFIVLYKHHSITAKKIQFSIIVYILAIILLIYLGTAGPGIIILFCISILVTLFISTRAGLISVAFNALIYFLLFWGFFLKSLDLTFFQEYSTISWIGVSLNLIAFNAIIVLSVSFLVDQLQESLLNDQKLQLHLKKEHINLLEAKRKSEESEEKLKTALFDANRFSEIMDNIPSYIYIKNKKHQYLHANQMTLKLFNRSKETLHGCDDTDFFPQASIKELWEIDNQVFENGITTQNEINVKNDDNTVTTYWEIKYPLYNEQDEIYGLCGISTDISDRKQVDQELIKLSSIVKQSSEGIAIADLEGKLVFANSAWIQMHDYETEEELIGKHLSISHNQEQLEKEVIPYNQKVMEKGFHSGEVGHIRKDGTPFPAYMNTTLVKNESGKPYAFAAIARDITELKQAELALKESEEKLHQLNTDKDRFISILGHDLKSPFNSLLGLSEVLVEDIRKLDIDEIEKIANSINKTAQNSFNLLDDLLMWARAQTDKVTFNKQKLSIKDVCMDILEIHKPNANAKNITLNCFTTDHVDVFADIDMLKTVLRNLVSNAIKFTKNDGAINIKAEENSENITISVSDNGIGITPDDLAKMFDISQVYTIKGTAGETGTGLGLLICKEFVEKHGGKIWVESKEGKGSTFYFTIPCKVE